MRIIEDTKYKIKRYLFFLSISLTFNFVKLQICFCHTFLLMSIVSKRSVWWFVKKVFCSWWISIYFHHLYAWWYIDIARRSLKLILFENYNDIISTSISNPRTDKAAGEGGDTRRVWGVGGNAALQGFFLANLKRRFTLWCW